MEAATKKPIQDAARLALQSAVAAVATFAVLRWIGHPEVLLGLISTVLIVQPSVGSTLKAGLHRLVATLAGSAAGALSLWLAPHDIGTAAALAGSMVLMNSVASYFPEWRYGAVPALAIAIGSEEGIWEGALDRFESIAVGVVVGVGVTLVVWPDPARARCERHLGRAAESLRVRLCRGLRALRCEAVDDVEPASEGVDAWLGQARDALGGMREEERRQLSERIESLEELRNTAILLERLARQASDGCDPGEGSSVEVQRWKEAEELVERSCQALAGEGEGLDGQLSGDWEGLVEGVPGDSPGSSPGGAQRFVLEELARTLRCALEQRRTTRAEVGA